MDQTVTVTRNLTPSLWTVRLFYFLAGIGMAAWAVIVPYTKIRFGLNDGTLGVILLAGGAGGVIGLPFCGPLVKQYGSRRVLILAAIGFGILLPAMTVAPNVPAFAALLFTFGMIFGAADVAMNAQAAVLETCTGKRHMSFFHASFSAGGLSVALATSLLLKLGLSNPACGLVYGAVIFLIVLQGGKLPPKRDDLPAEGPAFALPNRATLVLGLCCLACFLTEGAVTDWSAIFLKFSRGMSVSGAALGFAAFSLAMMFVRVLGDRAAMRFGAATVMRLGCGLAVVGFCLGIAVPYGPLGVLGFGLVGLGIGNIAPLVFSAAARVPGMAATHSVPAVVALGYIGFLLGPVIIGMVAKEFSLSVAFSLNAIFLVCITFASKAVAT